MNARDRIGKGPWQNAKGVVIAKDLDELHGKNNLTKETALTEKGEMVNGRTDSPNMLGAAMLARAWRHSRKAEYLDLASAAMSDPTTIARCRTRYKSSAAQC